MRFWTEEEDRFLIELFPQGRHAWLAKQMHEKFGHVYSKSSVISRSHKLGLYKISDTDREVSKRTATKNRKHNKTRELRRKLFNGPDIPITADGSAGQALANNFDQLARPDHLGIPLLRLKAQHCRFPKGEGVDITFCGQPVLEGQSYCEQCYRVCYVPPQRRQEAA